jgi:hypothetical protein
MLIKKKKLDEEITYGHCDVCPYLPILWYVQTILMKTLRVDWATFFVSFESLSLNTLAFRWSPNAGSSLHVQVNPYSSAPFPFTPMPLYIIMYFNFAYYILTIKIEIPI